MRNFGYAFFWFLKIMQINNSVVIEQTDLTLPGKNGIDVVIKRKYDNQEYNEAYVYTRTKAWFYTRNQRDICLQDCQLLNLVLTK